MLRELFSVRDVVSRTTVKKITLDPNANNSSWSKIYDHAALQPWPESVKDTRITLLSCPGEGRHDQSI